MNTFCKVEKDLLLNNFYTNRELISKDALAVMVCLGVNSIGIAPDGECENVFLSYGYLDYLMFKGKKVTTSEKQMIKNGFQELVNLGKIVIIKKIGISDFICDISNILKNKSNNFVKITYDEFYKIFSIRTEVNNTSLLRYYACLLGTFKEYKGKPYSYKIGTERQETLAILCRISVQSLVKYNEILKLNKLIYISKRKKYNNSNVKTGRLYNQLSNVYSKYDKGEEYCKQFMDDNNFVKIKKEFIDISNEMRSLSQKYNYFARVYKDKQCEDLDRVQAAYEAGKQWNEYTKQDFEQSIQDGKKVDEPKYKDLSIFEQYDLTI
mgnify:CR=1 FL=1